MSSSIKTIGILGAGKLGVVLSQLALKAGYQVKVAGSGDPSKIALSFSVLAPGAEVDWAEAVAMSSDVTILALPLSKYQSVPQKALAGKLVIDAMNHWWEVDGDRDDFIEPSLSSSQAVQQFLEESRVVKALNHMGYHDLHDETRSAGTDGRKAIAIAADDQADAKSVAKVVDDLGFDPLYIGQLENGRYLEPGYPAFGANVTSDTLRDMVEHPNQT